MAFDHGALIANAFGMKLFGRGRTAEDAPKALIDTVRPMTVGDSYAADITGEYQYNQGKVVPVIGTTTAVVSEYRLAGKAVLALSTLTSLTIEGTPQNAATVRLYTQDTETGNLLFIGRVEADEAINITEEPYLETPGQFSEEFTLTEERVFVNGEYEYVSLHVTGTDLVRLPLGKFHVWRCDEVVKSFGTYLTATAWYSPQLGPIPAREFDVLQFRDTGDTLTTETILRETNVL